MSTHPSPQQRLPLSASPRIVPTYQAGVATFHYAHYADQGTFSRLQIKIGACLPHMYSRYRAARTSDLVLIS